MLKLTADRGFEDLCTCALLQLRQSLLILHTTLNSSPMQNRIRNEAKLRAGSGGMLSGR